MAFKRKDLVFGATSKRMETQHLELVSDDFDKKKSKINNLAEETKTDIDFVKKTLGL